VSERPRSRSSQSSVFIVHLQNSLRIQYDGAFRRFDALTVEYARTVVRLASFNLAHLHDQQRVDHRPQVHVAPRVEISLHSRHRRTIPGQHPPSAPTRCNIRMALRTLRKSDVRGRPPVRRAAYRAQQTPIPGPSYRLDIPIQSAYTLYERYHPRPCGPPASRQRWLGHKPMISLNYFPFRP